MLVLSRKVGEEIIIGDNVRVKVLRFEGKKVRLGVIAPSNVTVHRSETQDKINKEMEEQFSGINVPQV